MSSNSDLCFGLLCDIMKVLIRVSLDSLGTEDFVKSKCIIKHAVHSPNHTCPRGEEDASTLGKLRVQVFLAPRFDQSDPRPA